MAAERMRRKTGVWLVALLMVTSLLAACRAQPGGGGDGAGGEFHGAYPYQMPPAGTFNTYANNALFGVTSIYYDVLEMPMAMYEWQAQEYVPLLATDWGFEPPDKFTVTLRDGVKWSDGNDFTAQDVITTFTLLRTQEATIWDYVDSVEAEGDNGLVFTMKKPSTVVERYVLREHIRSDAVYGDLAARAQKLFDQGLAPDDREVSKLRTELERFKPDEMVVTGPYNVDVDSMTESQLVMDKVDTAWNADQVQFDRLVIYNGETPAVTPLVLSGDVDYATHGFPIATEKQFEKQGIRILRPPTYSGPSLYFNYDVVKAVADPRVRQAIAYAIDRDQNGEVSLAASGKAMKYMAGASDILMEDWLSKEELAKLNTYDYNPDKGAQMLEDLGFKKQGGVWVSPDGEKMQYELNAPAEFADWSAAAQDLGEQLTDFGIKTTVRTVNFAQYVAQIQEGRFELAIQAWGQGRPHPHFSWNYPLLFFNTQAPGGGMHYDMTQTVPGMGKVDLKELLLDSALGLDVEKQEARVAQMATAFNELLPLIPLWERYGNNPALDTRVTGWPPDSDPLYINSPYEDSFTVMWILDGTLRPAE